MAHEIKKDKYLKARGGTAHFLLIKCAKCSNDILLYQKDGHGNLLRMYKDRIVAPEKLVAEQQKITNKNDMKTLTCQNCKTLIAHPMVYERENRLAYRVIFGAIQKIKNPGIWPHNEKTK